MREKERESERQRYRHVPSTRAMEDSCRAIVTSRPGLAVVHAGSCRTPLSRPSPSIRSLPSPGWATCTSLLFRVICTYLSRSLVSLPFLSLSFSLSLSLSLYLSLSTSLSRFKSFREAGSLRAVSVSPSGVRASLANTWAYRCLPAGRPLSKLTKKPQCDRNSHIFQAVRDRLARFARCFENRLRV